MSQKFQANVSQRRGISFVKMSGIVDEDNRLTDLIDQIGAGTVVIDLAEVDRINSCGVRDWVNWLGRVEAKPSRVILVECSPSIVAQVNLVSNFTGGGSVKSFYAPYFCSECNQEKVLLVDVADLGPSPVEPPTCRCDDCDLVMAFDDMPDSYFAFLSNPAHRALIDGDALDGAIREFAAGEFGERSKIRSRVGASHSGGTPAPPSVPSLQSIARVSTAQPVRMPSPSVIELPPVPGASPKPAAGPGGYPYSHAPKSSQQLVQPMPLDQPSIHHVVQGAPTHALPRSGGNSSMLVAVLIAALAVSIGLLIYLLAF